MYNYVEEKSKIIILEQEEMVGAFLKKNFKEVLPCKYIQIKEYAKGIVAMWYEKRVPHIMAYDFDGKGLIPKGEYQSVVIADDCVRTIDFRGNEKSFYLE